MNNNWLSFPLSPTHSSLPAHDLQATQYHQFSLGLVNENMENPFQNHGNLLSLPLLFLLFLFLIFFYLFWLLNYLINSTDWSLINTHSSSEVPKVADFLGVSKSENQSDLAAINEIRSNDSDYLFTNNSLVPMQNQVVDTLAMSIKKMLIAIYNH